MPRAENNSVDPRATQPILLNYRLGILNHVLYIYYLALYVIV